MNVGACIVRNLEAIGVERIFGGAGEANAAMLLELKKSRTIKPVIVKNEQGASFMACGYSMFSDKLGVCMSTAGPGEFNLFSGLAVALSDSLPVLALSGFVPKSHAGKGSLNEATGLNRTPDSRAMFAATTKKTFFLERADQACDVLEEAVNLAFAGRPGPVHLHLPTDVIGLEVPNYREIQLDVAPVLPDAAQVSRIVDVLAGALERGEPVLAIIGYGAVRSRAEAELLALVERFQIPFVATMDAKGVLPEDHPLSLGGLGTSGDPGAKAYFHEAKVVLAMGNSFAQNATFTYREGWFAGKTLIHVNIDPAEIGKVYPADHGLVSDVKPAVRQLHRGLEARVGAVPGRSVKADKFVDHPIEYSGPKIHPAHLVEEMSRLMPANAIVMGDAGGHMLWLNCYLHLTRGQIYQNPGSFGPMASMVNGAIGAKIACPDRPVVAGCGDGAYLMAGFEYLTAVQYRVPVVWVIFNNGGFNVIKQFQMMTHGEEAFTEFPSPDYVQYAKACGGRGYRVEKLEEFGPAFTEALGSGEPVLIDVQLDADVFPPFDLSHD